MADKKIPTICAYCGTGCNLLLKVRNGKVIGVLPSSRGAGQGKLCIKGWSAHEFIHHPDRLTAPLMRARKGEPLQKTTWETALSRVADGLLEIKKVQGSNALGFIASARCTNEENYLFQKLARAVLRTNNVDHCARL